MKTESGKLSAILLAAGLSKRMGCDKLLLEHNGKTLLERAISLLLALPADERIIVGTEERLKHITLPETGCKSSVKIFINPNPGNGISSSMHIGIENAAGTHFLFLNADQPELTASGIMPLISLSGSNPGKIVYPLIDGMPCSPAIFPATLRDELLRQSGDTGGRAIRDAHPEMCLSYIPVSPENFMDIDYLQDMIN